MMQDNDRIVPTLENIPAELKLAIADHFDPDVPLDLRWSGLAQHDAQSRRAAIRSLSLVSRSWAAALEDLRWQTLHIRATDTKRLLELARDWMPRYGAKVKTLLITHWTDVDLGNQNLSRRTEILAAQHTLDAAERVIGLKPSSGELLERLSELHDALTATIVRACSNVVALKLIQRTPLHHVARDKGGEVVVRSSRTDDALRAVGSNVDSADVVCQGTSADVDSRAAEYLDSWPNIRHLGIHINEQPYHDMTNFFYKVSRMRQLVSLELATANVSAWLELQSGTPPNLSHFSLSGIRNLDLMQLAGVLTHQPVISLCLRQFSVSDFLPPHWRPDGLRIEYLSISGCTASILLDFFDSAPLKSVEFCANRPGGSAPSINTKRLKAFILKHCATLSSFKIGRALLSPSADLSTINRWLKQQGISVRVVTVE